MDFKNIEKKWQDIWDKEQVFKAEDFSEKKPYYTLIEFPYPSGVGLHLGHVKAYSALEVVSRKKRLEGYNVLFPIGFDAFGLPTENFAIKYNIPPRKATDDNIANMTMQLKRMGFSFDWSRVIDTTDENYYKWTQWIFLQLFKKGLAYKSKSMVNYCPKCDCVLSNEESQGGVCDRCNTEVVQKEKDVWFLKIREYAERLLEGLDDIECPQRIKEEQRNWIGKSTGAQITFGLATDDGKQDSFEIYTTRADTLFGVTFMVVAPEHPILEKYKDSIKNYSAVTEYQEQAKRKSEFDRIQLNKDKTGVMLEGVYAVHPITNKQVPIFISDYVMMGYGTGAIMAVPAHDTRDWEFAKKFNIDIIPVIEGGDIEKEAFTDIATGKLINSDFLNGLSVKDAKAKMIAYVAEKGFGKAQTNYQMKDWAFNRQRYWGEPFPIVYCDKCGTVPVPEDQLPVKLPEVKNFKPSKNGESPLAEIDEWVNCTCPICGGKARRETDTMPQWAGSSWYYLRYIDPKNTEALADPKKLEYWGNIDWYNGGMEHVTRHLIYARFWNMFLYDIGAIPNKEPFKKRTAQGLILAENGEKMSKSAGTSVDPMETVDEYGADVLRLYILFMSDYEAAAPWSNKNISGCKRFLERIERMVDFIDDYKGIHPEHVDDINTIISKVTEDIDNLKYNTAIASLMTFVNKIYNDKFISHEEFSVLITLLYPFAPHFSEEMNEVVGNKTMVCKTPWPKQVESTGVKKVKMPIQVNGKVRNVLEIAENTDKDTVIEMVKADEKIANAIAGMNITNIIFVPNKIVNIIVK